MHMFSRIGVVIVLVMAIGAVATSCRNSSDDKNGNKKRLGSEYELRFLRDIGINPDTLLLDEVVEYKSLLQERDRKGATWLSMEQISALRLDELCEADTANSPVRMMAALPVDKHITLLMFQIYYGDQAPVIFATYNSDGVPVDVLSVGTLTGVNTAYDDAAQQAIGHEEATITFNGKGHFMIDRTLQFVAQGQQPLWSISNVDVYQVDTRGYILHLEGQSGGDEPEMFAEQRRLEALSWYSLQDEGMIAALAQMEGALTKNADEQVENLLADRFEKSHWTILPWLKEHPDSRLMTLLQAGARKRGLDKELREKLQAK